MDHQSIRIGRTPKGPPALQHICQRSLVLAIYASGTNIAFLNCALFAPSHLIIRMNSHYLFPSFCQLILRILSMVTKPNHCHKIAFRTTAWADNLNEYLLVMNAQVTGSLDLKLKAMGPNKCMEPNLYMESLSQSRTSYPHLPFNT
jgi:hypothetical protein